MVKNTRIPKIVRFKYSFIKKFYSLLKEAKMSWKKTKNKNPARNDELVEAKKKEIEKKLEDWKPE